MDNLIAFVNSSLDHNAAMFRASVDDKCHQIDVHNDPTIRRSIQIIELVECTSPPHVASSICLPGPSSYYESSSSSDDDSDDESECSSYCSSDGPDPRVPDQSASDDRQRDDDTYSTRMRRIHAWRASYVNEPPSAPAHAKRKVDEHDEDNTSDSASRSSKRWRHHCSACESSFATTQSLRRHGTCSGASDACRAAVQYGLE